MAKYLDKTSLTNVWSKIKDKFQPKLVSGTTIKTVNGQSILGSGNIAISSSSSSSSSSYEEITDGMFELQDALSIDLSAYDNIIIIFEEIMGVEQPQTNIEISNSSLRLKTIPLEYAIGIPFIVKLERMNEVDFLLTANGGCIPFAGIITDVGEGIGFSFEDGTQSEMYYYRVFAK